MARESLARQGGATPIGYATCRETVTSPAPSPGAIALGLKANQPCGARVAIYAMGGMGVVCQCPLGHHLHVMPDDVEGDPTS